MSIPPTGKPQCVALKMHPDLLARLDAWRKAQPGEPTRSQAIRWLLDKKLRETAAK